MTTMTRFLAVALAVLTAASAGSAGAQEVSGLAFDVSVITGDSATGVPQTGRGWIYGKRSRIDLKGPANPTQAIPGMPGQNISMIVHDSAEAAIMAVVDHDSRKFFYPARMMAQLNDMMASLPELPRLSISVANVVVDTLGDGHTVSGFATKRFRISADITLSMDVPGERMQQEMHIESEGDFAEDLADFTDPIRDTRGLGALRAGLPMWDSGVTAELDKLVKAAPRGLVLRQVDRISGATESGDRAETSTTLLSNVRRTTFPLSTFALPEGYTELEMPLMPQLNEER